VARLFAARDGDRPATGPLVVALLGVAAFVASLILDWVTLSRVTDSSGTETPNNQELVEEAPEALSLGQSLVDADALGLVYVLGVVALLGVTAALVARPESALRHRLGLTGAAVGLGGVVAAAVVRLPTDALGTLGVINYPGQPEFLRASYEPGAFVAFGAVVLPVVAVWLAARPAVRAVVGQASTVPVVADDEDGPDDGPGPAPAAAVEPRGWGRRRRGARPDPEPPPHEPPDLTVTPDVLHR
jgi:hypothetical protein